MSNFHPSYVFDEQRATGWVRFEVFGDVEQGRRLFNAGRSLLGALRSQTGVNQAQVDGRDIDASSGFYQRWATFPDGTRIHAMSNGGQDTIRIYAVSPKIKVEEKEEPRDVSVSTDDYVWIGVRVKDGCVHPWFGLSCYVIEPDGTPERGIIADVMGFPDDWGLSYIVQATAAGEEPMVINPYGDYWQYLGDRTIDTMLAEMWASYGPPYSNGMSYGEHHFSLSIERPSDSPGVNSTLVSFTRNGLLGMTRNSSTQGWGPYDPRLSAEDNAGASRDTSAMQWYETLDYWSWRGEYMYAWDYVFWIDPAEQEAKDQGLECDGRADVLGLKKFLGDKGLIHTGSRQILDGDYTLVCQAYSEGPHWYSDRAGESVSGLSLLPSTYRRRSGYCDLRNFSTYRKDPPMEIEVEIRLGRKAASKQDGSVEAATVGGKTFTFSLTCEEYDDRYAVIHPYGFYDTDQCGREGGPNMGGPSFSQTIKFNPKKLMAKLGGSVGDSMFGARSYVGPYEDRTPGLIFVHGKMEGSSSSPETWPSDAGSGVFMCLEYLSTGVLGCTDAVGISEQDAQGLFAGTSPDNMYLFDCLTNELTDLGPPPTDNGYWAAHDPPYYPAFYWFYQTCLPYVLDCKHCSGVLATGAGTFYEFTDHLAGSPGFEPPYCC